MPGWLDLSVRMKGEAPSIAVAKVTDPAGNVLSFSEGDKSRAQLEPAERAAIPLLTADKAECLDLPHNRWECAKAIYVGNTLRGIAWVEFDERASTRAASCPPARHRDLRRHLGAGIGSRSSC